MVTAHRQLPLRSTTAIIVRTSPRQHANAILSLGKTPLACAIGRSGVTGRKREGDGGTPLGTFKLLRVIYRPDRARRPRTGLPVRQMRPNDGWCDAPTDRNYNRPVPWPYPASAEQMWRADGLYDIVVVLGHNQCPRIRGAGSAIFMHLARRNYAPTEGCIALEQPHLERILRYSRPGSVVRIVS